MDSIVGIIVFCAVICRFVAGVKQTKKDSVNQPGKEKQFTPGSVKSIPKQSRQKVRKPEHMDMGKAVREMGKAGQKEPDKVFTFGDNNLPPAERLIEGDSIPKDRIMVKCSYCGAENLVPVHANRRYACYFCREVL